MTPEIYISTAAFGGIGLEEIIAQCQIHGIDCLELSSRVTIGPGWRDALRAARGRGIKFLVHNYFPPPVDPFVLNLAAIDVDIRERSIAFCREAIELTAELGAGFYSVHSGFGLNLTPEMLGRPDLQAAAEPIPRDAARETFLASVRELIPCAKAAGVRLLLENNVLSRRYLERQSSNPLLMCDPEEIVWFMQLVADPAVGLLFDTGHAKVSGMALGFEMGPFVNAVAPYIGAWHVSDNDGVTDQNHPCRADSWFLPALRAHRAPIVVEVASLDSHEILQQSALLRAALS